MIIKNYLLQQSQLHKINQNNSLLKMIFKKYINTKKSIKKIEQNYSQILFAYNR